MVLRTLVRYKWLILNQILTMLAIRTAFKYRLKVKNPKLDLEEFSFIINIAILGVSFYVCHREMQWFEASTCAVFVLSSYYILHRLCGGDYLVAVSGQVLVFIVAKYACSGFAPLFALSTGAFIITASLEILLLLTFIYSVYMSWQDAVALAHDSLAKYEPHSKEAMGIIE